MPHAQVTRPIGRYREAGHLQDRRSRDPARPFEMRCTSRDIRLLAETDALLGQLCGPATRAVMRRQHEAFGNRRFARPAGLSNGHLYNLRKSRTYRYQHSVFSRTRPTTVRTGQRAKTVSGWTARIPAVPFPAGSAGLSEAGNELCRTGCQGPCAKRPGRTGIRWCMPHGRNCSGDQSGHASPTVRPTAGRGAMSPIDPAAYPSHHGLPFTLPLDDPLPLSA